MVMRKKHSPTDESVLDQITQSLREHPELASRILSIMKLADEPMASGRIRSADEVETLLIEELRKLGNETLSNWGEGVNDTVGEALKTEEAQVRMREKKL